MIDEIVSGYAIVFPPERSLLLGDEFVEEVEPGAVSMSQLEGDDVRVLVGHDPLRPVGRLSAGNVRLAKDPRGLKVAVALPDVTWANDALTIINRGIAPGWSFAFRTIRDSWRWEGGTVLVRTVLAMAVRELSLQVTFAAYPGTEKRSAGIETSDGADGRAGARQLAAYMRRLAKVYPDCSPRITGFYDETELRWEFELVPRDFARERREQEWAAYREDDARREREWAVLLAKNPRLKAQIEGRRRVQWAVAASARPRGSTYRP